MIFIETCNLFCLYIQLNYSNVLPTEVILRFIVRIKIYIFNQLNLFIKEYKLNSLVFNFYVASLLDRFIGSVILMRTELVALLFKLEKEMILY